MLQNKDIFQMTALCPRKDIFQMTALCPRKGLFTLPDPDSDSKPDGYIVLCRSFHIGSDLDPDPTQMVSQMITVPILGTDLHPKDRCLSQFYYISIRGVQIRTNGIFLHSTVIQVRVRIPRPAM